MLPGLRILFAITLLSVSVVIFALAIASFLIGVGKYNQHYADVHHPEGKEDDEQEPATAEAVRTMGQAH